MSHTTVEPTHHSSSSSTIPSRIVDPRLTLCPLLNNLLKSCPFTSPSVPLCSSSTGVSVSESASVLIAITGSCAVSFVPLEAGRYMSRCPLTIRWISNLGKGPLSRASLYAVSEILRIVDTDGRAKAAHRSRRGKKNLQRQNMSLSCTY
jgi:hypothetical protein